MKDLRKRKRSQCPSIIRNLLNLCAVILHRTGNISLCIFKFNNPTNTRDLHFWEQYFTAIFDDQLRNCSHIIDPNRAFKSDYLLFCCLVLSVLKGSDQFGIISCLMIYLNKIRRPIGVERPFKYLAIKCLSSIYIFRKNCKVVDFIIIPILD